MSSLYGNKIRLSPSQWGWSVHNTSAMAAQIDSMNWVLPLGRREAHDRSATIRTNDDLDRNATIRTNDDLDRSATIRTNDDPDRSATIRTNAPTL
jgi:hypothetical protein